MRRMHILGSGRIRVGPRPLMGLSDSVGMTMRERGSEERLCLIKTCGGVRGKRGNEGEGG